MLHVKVLAVALSFPLAAGVAFAQQAGQSSPQQGWQQRSQSSYGGAGGSMALSQQDIQQLAQSVDKDKASLDKCIDKAKSQVKDSQVLGAAFVQEQAGSSSSGQPLLARVFVVANNQLHDVVVDAKNHKVQSTSPQQMIANPWQMSASGQGAMQAGGQGLTLSTAQNLAQLSKQDSVDFRKAINKADSQVKGNVIGAFLVLPSQVGTAAQQKSSGEKANLFCKVYIVDKSNQLHEVIVDPKNDKVVNTQTLQSLSSPWEGRFGSSGMGGSSGGSQQQNQGSH